MNRQDPRLPMMSEAVIEYLDNDFRVVRAGAFVRCAVSGAIRYRVPTMPSMDGNTVEMMTEQTAFAENAVAYQTTLAFLNGRISQLTRALRGE